MVLVLIYLIPRVGSVEISRIDLKVSEALRHRMHAAGLVSAQVVMSGVVELVWVLGWMILGGRVAVVACRLLR